MHWRIVLKIYWLPAKAKELREKRIARMQQEKQEDEFDKITNALDFSTVEIDESS